MIARFIQLYDCVKPALIDLNLSEYLIDDSIPLLRELSACLRPLKMAIEALSRRDSDLLKSEGVLKFVYEELENGNGTLSLEIVCAVQTRITERRNVEVVSILKYLLTKDLSLDSASLSYLSKRNIHKIVGDLIVKMFGTTQSECESMNTDSDNAVSISNENVLSDNEDGDIEFEYVSAGDGNTMNVRLLNAINKTIRIASICPPNLNQVVKQELAHFEATGNLGTYLKKLKSSLQSIQATSTECERIFSTASNICTKKRTRLSDKSLNAICFLKTFTYKI